MPPTLKDAKAIWIKHRLTTSWTHWVNFPVLGVMIWSGLLIYWANDVYKIGWGDTTILKFFPTTVYEALNLPFRLAQGMAFHFLFMWLFFANGIIYVLFTIASGEWRQLMPARRTFKEAWEVLLFDLRLRKQKPPQGKFNAAQRVAYSAIIFMGTGSVATGLAIYKPVQLHWLCALLGGYEAARVQHFALTIGYVLFFVVHIVQVALAGWNNFQAMVTGFELLPQPDATASETPAPPQLPAMTPPPEDNPTQNSTHE
jgi:thiosulfate reductase cytochrome b subunit